MKYRLSLMRATIITYLFITSSTVALASPCPPQLPYRVFLPLIIGGSASTTAIDLSGGWRLPFDSTKTVTDGPGEGLHIGRSAQAIDYAMSGQSFPVLAPADGVVLDVLQDPSSTTPNFGWVVRINHNNLYSFFAHLDPSNIFVSAGQRVTQGQCIAMSYKSGLPSSGGIHLHYEARTSAVSGNIFNGQASPTRAIPGNWWNPWYSPAPDFRNDPAQPSGGAQYPESRSQPSTLLDPNGRHLANLQSPPNAVNAYLSNVFGPTPNGFLTIHLGASPNTPSNNYKTLFSVYKWNDNPGVWNGISYTYSPALDDYPSSYNQSYASGQHTYLIQGNTLGGIGTTDNRFIELFTDGTNGIPHIVASYTGASDATFLEYCAAGAVQYEVDEYHGGSVTVAYSGPDCSILVHRIIGSTNWYTVRAQYNSQWPSTGGWTQFTNWLIVHN